ncbi:MAG TPA: TIGR01459 family HAD-type hydrolase [Acetobacteraceae bacterium]|nr:TIGR01459 family HAD-type hydrolase [Acetobacteraceae bacterium]
MRILPGIAPVAERYDGFVLDLWGVVHDGRAPYPGVPEALAELKRRGKRVVFLTNAPRRAWFVRGMLDRMGLDAALYDGIVSSGEFSWSLLKQRTHPWFARLGRRCVHIGPERDLSVVEDRAADIVDRVADADFLLNTGPDPQRGPKSPAPYVPMLEECRAAGLPMLCVNPDRAVMVAGERLICAGALSDVYRELGGEVMEIGKPDPAVYDPVLEILGNPPRSRVLAIGDSPHTDLAGAQAAGMDALWALTGLAADAYGESPEPLLLRDVAVAEGVTPIAAVKGLRW